VRTVSHQCLYTPLVSEADLQKLQKKESLGVAQFKDFHLKEASVYDSHLKDKIFFIGQNNFQAQQTAEQAQESIAQIARRKKARKIKLS
jgi:hypothetical protein